MRIVALRRALVGLCLLLSSGLVAANVAVDRAELVQTEQMVGAGKLTWWGLTVYRASLYAKKGQYAPEQAHALKIEYAFSFTREQLAERSLEEMENIFGTLPNRDQVLQALLQAMPNVEEDDVITGVHSPGHGAVFYLNDQQISRLSDPDIAAKFFSIWLDEKTSEPELRMALIGGKQ